MAGTYHLFFFHFIAEDERVLETEQIIKVWDKLGFKFRCFWVGDLGSNYNTGREMCVCIIVCNMSMVVAFSI